jgi:hypothetical protein
LRSLRYYGNTTLQVSPEAPEANFTVNGNLLAEGAYNAYKPAVWEGLRKYDMEYRGRTEGLDYKGNKTLRALIPNENLQFELDNVQTFDGKNPVMHYWPPRYIFADNITKESKIDLIRYEPLEEAWEANRRLSDNKEFDYFGMPVRIPPGMSSTRTLSGFGTVVGTPHHIGNQMWGGKEVSQVKGLTPDTEKHRFHIDVEPISGNVMRIAKRLQYSVRVERGALMNKIISSQGRCQVPSAIFNPAGFGCFMYFPLLWYDDERVFEEAETMRFQETYLTVPKTLIDTTTITVAFSVFLCVLGAVVYFLQWKKWHSYKARIFLD